MSQPNNPHHPDDDYGQTNAQGGGQYGDYASAGDTSHGTGGYDFAVEHNQSVENQQPANAYYAGGYEAPQYSGFEAQQETKNPVAPWALGIGILSLVGSLIVLGSFLGLIGFVVAIVSLVKGRKRQPENRRTVMSVVGPFLLASSSWWSGLNASKRPESLIALSNTAITKTPLSNALMPTSKTSITKSRSGIVALVAA